MITFINLREQNSLSVKNSDSPSWSPCESASSHNASATASVVTVTAWGDHRAYQDSCGLEVHLRNHAASPEKGCS